MKSGLLLTTTLFLALVCVEFTAAQSTSQDFPTPVTSSEISGSIKARDIGDSRLTTYFYTFNGDQGDLFINIVTRNFTGDLDIFTIAGLRPVTKIVVYANDSENETGRAVYFRKSEKLLLRIQGRSPNDDAASFKIKFAGSFVAARESDVLAEPELPKVNTGRESGIRVNSVGTILPPPPKPVKTEADPVDSADSRNNDEKDAETVAAADPPKTDVEKLPPGLEIVVTDSVSKKDDADAKPVRGTPASRRRRPPSRPVKPKTDDLAVGTKSTDTPAEDLNPEATNKTPPPVKKTLPKRSSRTPKKATVPKEPMPDPLASIRLVIAFKDGSTLEKSMNEVFKFSVDKGILTVILKDRSVSRYPILDIAKVTIE